MPPSPFQKWGGFTCSTRPERGSITRSFLSLHVVLSKLPSVLKDMQRMTSAWQSIIFTGSPTSKFHMRTCQGTVGGGQPGRPRRGALSRWCPTALSVHMRELGLVGLDFCASEESYSMPGLRGWHISSEGRSGSGAWAPFFLLLAACLHIFKNLGLER